MVTKNQFVVRAWIAFFMLIPLVLHAATFDQGTVYVEYNKTTTVQLPDYLISEYNYHSGVPYGGGGTLSWSVSNDALVIEGTNQYFQCKIRPRSGRTFPSYVTLTAQFFSWYGTQMMDTKATWTVKLKGSGSDTNTVLVTQIFISPSSLNLEVGDVKGLYALVYPTKASNQSVSWTSENPNIASVDSNGKVTAQNMGATNIICSAKDGSGIKAICPVEEVAKNGEFTAQNSDGIEMLFRVISEANKTCGVGSDYSGKRAIDINTTGKIVVPQTVKGYTVVAVMDKAFSSCASITSVELPSTIKKIRYDAFNGCTSLSQITGISNVEYIEASAFGNTPWYDSLPDGPIYIGKTFFTYKGEIPENTTIKIKEGTKSIAEYAFYKNYPDGRSHGCNENLIAVEIPSSVVQIGREEMVLNQDELYFECPSITGANPNPFYCPHLQSIVIDSGNKYYESPENCNAIIEKQSGILIAACNNTVIPSSVRIIAPGAFGASGMDEMTSLIIPDNVEIFGGIGWCDNLENLFIGKNVKKIGRCIRNDKLSTISVSKNNSYYDSRNDCNAVIHKETATLILGCSSSEIPSQVEIINDNAFRNGHNYETPLRIIPDGVRKIGNSAFYDPSFRNLVIGKNVEIIEDYAFGSNSKSMNKLTSIYSLNEYPKEISEKAFYADIYERGTLYVPTSSKINYMGTKGWNKFKHIEEFDPSEFDPTALGVSTIQLDNKDNNRIFSLSGQQLATPKKGLNIINRKKVLSH